MKKLFLFMLLCSSVYAQESADPLITPAPDNTVTDAPASVVEATPVVVATAVPTIVVTPEPALTDAPRPIAPAQNVVRTETINVDGQFQDFATPVPTVQLTEAEKARIRRAALEKRTEQQMKNKIEEMRVRREIELNKNLQKTFDENLKKIDGISNQQ